MNTGSGSYFVTVTVSCVGASSVLLKKLAGSVIGVSPAETTPHNLWVPEVSRPPWARSPSSRRQQFGGSRGGRLRSRRHAQPRQTSHNRISYPIHHSRGREPSSASVIVLTSILFWSADSSGCGKLPDRSLACPGPGFAGARSPFSLSLGAGERDQVEARFHRGPGACSAITVPRSPSLV